MNKSLRFAVVFFTIAASPLTAQEHQAAGHDRMIPELRRSALVLDINARVLSAHAEPQSAGSENIIWNENHQKLAIPGSPVSIQLVGSNVVVAVQFTPFIRRRGNVLVAQGQIWISDPNNGVGYYTSIQTIPMEFNEPIHFFPLGTSEHLNSTIEIILTVTPYREQPTPEAAISANNDD